MDIIFSIRLPNLAVIAFLLIGGLSAFWFGLGYFLGLNRESDGLAVISLLGMVLGAGAVIVAAFLIKYYSSFIG